MMSSQLESDGRPLAKVTLGQNLLNLIVQSFPIISLASHSSGARKDVINFIVLSFSSLFEAFKQVIGMQEDCD